MFRKQTQHTGLRALPGCDPVLRTCSASKPASRRGSSWLRNSRRWIAGIEVCPEVSGERRREWAKAAASEWIVAAEAASRWQSTTVSSR